MPLIRMAENRVLGVQARAGLQADVELAPVGFTPGIDGVGQARHGHGPDIVGELDFRRQLCSRGRLSEDSAVVPTGIGINHPQMMKLGMIR